MVIVDVVLPGMNGIDSAILIESKWPECYISLFSGQAATSDLLAMTNTNGHNSMFSRPVHPTELLGIAGPLVRGSPSLISAEN